MCLWLREKPKNNMEEEHYCHVGELTEHVWKK